MHGAACCILCRHETNNELRLNSFAVRDHEYLHIGRWIKSEFTKDELLMKWAEFTSTTIKENASPDNFLMFLMAPNNNFTTMCVYARCEVMLATIGK